MPIKGKDVLGPLGVECLQLGVDIHYPPQEDRGIPGYWELFIFDPDGLRIEAAYYAPGVVVESTA